MTPVMFRKDKSDNEIVAVFPTFDEGRRLVTIYVHFGQHGAASWAYVQGSTVPANETEYAKLLRELVQVGYDDLKVYKRRPA